MAEEIIIKIDVQSSAAKKSLDSVSDSSEKLAKSTDKIATAKRELNFQLSKQGAELAKLKKAVTDQTNLNKKNAASTIANTKGVSSLNKAKAKLASLQSREAIDLAKVNEQIKIQAEINTNLAKSELGLASAKTKAARAAQQFRTQSGLQNAILLESGRLASDLSFGFTAIANNLSQLVSLFGSLIDTSKNFTTSMKNLGKSLLGTGGVLLAVQLFIAALQSKKVADFVKSIFGATAAVRELQKALSEATDVYGAQIGKLSTLTRLLEDKRINDKQRSNILKELKKDNEDLNIELDENNQLTEESNTKLEAKIQLLKIQAQTQALVTAIEKQTVEQLELQNSSVTDNVSILGVLTGALNSFGNVNQAITSGVIKGEKDRQEAIADTQVVIDKLYEELVKVVNFGDDDDTKNGDRRVRRFKQQFIDLTKTILDYNKTASKINSISAQEQLDIDEEFAVKEADRKRDQFIERQSQRLEEYKEQVKDRKDANKLIADAEKEYRDSVTDAEVKHKELLISIEDAYITSRILLKDKEARQIAAIERKIENAELKFLKSRIGNNELFYNKKIEQVSGDIKLEKAALNTTEMNDVDRAKARQRIANLTIQQAELEAQAEVASVREKQRINREYIGFAQGISSLLGTIAGENKAIQNAALVVEKGAAVADVVINAQSSNAVARANLTAKAANPAALLALTPIVEAQIQRNNIGAGIAIANILATTLSNAKKPRSQASATTSVQAPAFNVVGPSTTDQLLGTVGEGLNDLKVNVSLYEIEDGLNNVNLLNSESSVT